MCIKKLIFSILFGVFAYSLLYVSISNNKKKEDTNPHPLSLKKLPVNFKGENKSQTLRSSYFFPECKFTEDYVPSVLNKESLRKYVEPLVPTKGDSLGLVLHVLHMGGELPESVWKGQEELKRLLISKELATEWFGTRGIHKQTRNGVRFAMSGLMKGDCQSHLGQAASVLFTQYPDKELENVIKNAYFTKNDLVEELKSSFSPEVEFEWTATALVYSDPKCKSWTNNFGETFNHNDLAIRAMYESAVSCGGLHRLELLSLYDRISQINPLLSDATQIESRDFLKKAVVFLQESQLADGSVDPSWFSRFQKNIHQRERKDDSILNFAEAAVRSDNLSRLLVTSHSIEWAVHPPVSSEVSSSFLQKARTYLQTQLEQSSPEIRRKHFCHYSHAITALVLLTHTSQ